VHIRPVITQIERSTFFFHVQISIGAIATRFLTHENSFIWHVPFILNLRLKYTPSKNKEHASTRNEENWTQKT
jgi:hypothetical protein